MRLSDTIYRMMQDSRLRIIETMRERNMKKVNLIMTQEEFAKENDFDDVDDCEDDYSDYRNNEAPWVIFFDKWGNGRDYAALSAELVDGEHPHFKLECYNSEDGSDTFCDYDLTKLSMVNVYERMAEELELEDEKDYVWVFKAEQAWDGEAADVIVRAFASEEAAVKFMHDFIHDDGDESIEQYVERKGWEVEHDEPTLYRAYEDGRYSTDHIEITITKCEIEK